ncbi:MAG: aromatic amino acid lyase [Gaiellaceae bacterium]
MTVRLTGSQLTLDDLVQVARHRANVELTEEALAWMQATRAVVDRSLARSDTVYGLTTGVGAKKSAAVEQTAIDAHNRLLVLNHRVGQGPTLPSDVARGALLRLANHLASGEPGARPELAQAVVAALNAGVEPRVRSLGSIGIADLSANADLAHDALGDFALAPGEGIAVLNHNAVSTAHAALALADAATFLDTIDVAGALDLEAFGANLGLLDPAVASARPYDGLRIALTRLREALAGSFLWDASHARNLQDPLSFRCLPQMHGAARDALRFAEEQLAVELNAHQGNPLVVAGDDERIVSVGNFDILPLSTAIDFARIALAPVLTAACERTVKLLQRPLSGLPEGVAARPGIAEDGLAEFGIAIQAIAAEARLLAAPVSFHIVSTTQAEGIEDRMTMAPLGARRLAEMIELAARIVAIEVAVAAQAIDLRGLRPLGTRTARVYALVRTVIPETSEGNAVPQELEPLVDLVRSGAFVEH